MEEDDNVWLWYTINSVTDRESIGSSIVFVQKYPGSVVLLELVACQQVPEKRGHLPIYRFCYL